MDRIVEVIEKAEDLTPRSELTVLAMAGGFSTRMNGVTQNATTKALLPIETDNLKMKMMDEVILRIPYEKGVEVVVLTNNDSRAFPDEVEKHMIEDWGGFRKDIRIYRQHELLGVGGAIMEAVNTIQNLGKYIAVVPTDTRCPANELKQALEKFKSSGTGACWVVTDYVGNDTQNPKMIEVENGVITAVHEGEANYVTKENGVTSAGIVLFDKEYFKSKYQEYVSKFPDSKGNLYSGFMRWLASTGEKVSIYQSHQEVYDMGTPERYDKVKPQLKN